MKKNEKSKNKGFALLIGVLMAAILISIAYSLFGVTLKQATLAVAGKDSQIAFYAADTGMECALYADYKIDQAFVKASYDGVAFTLLTPDVPPQSLTCNGSPIKDSFVTSDTENMIKTSSGDSKSAKVILSSFTVKSQKDNSCAKVEVRKYVLLPSGTELETKIQSRGYSTCNENDPQRLERGLEVYY